MQTPEQDPSALETALIANDQLSALNSESTSIGDIQGQLGNVSNVYSSVSQLLDSVQSVIEQALNGTTSSQGTSLANQVTATNTQMLGLANTTGTNGTFLFGGTRGTVQPFQVQPDGTIVYMGDGGQSQAAISPDLSASTIATGEAFTSGLQGDGTSSITATSTNAGTGVLLSEGESNPTTAAAFQQGNTPITLSFANNPAGGLTFTATTGAPPTTLATGPATAGSSLTLDGADFSSSPAPPPPATASRSRRASRNRCSPC